MLLILETIYSCTNTIGLASNRRYFLIQISRYKISITVLCGKTMYLNKDIKISALIKKNFIISLLSEFTMRKIDENLYRQWRILAVKTSSLSIISRTANKISALSSYHYTVMKNCHKPGLC